MHKSRRPNYIYCNSFKKSEENVFYQNSSKLSFLFQHGILYPWVYQVYFYNSYLVYERKNVLKTTDVSAGFLYKQGLWENVNVHHGA